MEEDCQGTAPPGPLPRASPAPPPTSPTPAPRARSRPPVPLSTVFWAALGAMALLLHPGIYINDETAQVAGLHELARGSLLVHGDQPDGFEPFLRGAFGHWGVPEPGEPPVPAVGSPLLNLLALPVLAVLSVVAWPTSTRVALAVAPAVLVWLGARGAWRATGRPVPRWLPWAVALVFLPPVWQDDLPATPYLGIAALHLVSMAGAAWMAALLIDLLRPRVGEAGALWTAGILLLASPVLFWSHNAKYHGLAIALCGLALWTYQDGWRSSPLRTFLAYAVAGLAVFNYLPIGGLLVLTLAVASLPAVALGAKPLLQRAGAAAAGLALGLVPEVMHRWAVSRVGSAEQFVVGVGHEAVGDGPALLGILGASSRLLDYSAIADPVGALGAALRITFWTDWTRVGHVMPMLVVGPWALLAVVTLARRRGRRALGTPLILLALAHLVTLVVLVGRGLEGTGAGFDPRYAATAWPFLAVLAAPTLAEARAAPTWKDEVAWAGTLVAGLVCLNLALNGALHAVGWSLTRQVNLFDETLLLRLSGLAAMFGLAYSWAGARALPWRTAWATVAAAIAFGTQATLQVGMANWYGVAPFSAWPLEALARLARWLLFDT